MICTGGKQNEVGILQKLEPAISYMINVNDCKQGYTKKSIDSHFVHCVLFTCQVRLQTL